MLLMRSFMDVLEYNKKGDGLRMIRYREKRNPRILQSKAANSR